jgi:ribosomal protein L37AE/L43A
MTNFEQLVMDKVNCCGCGRPMSRSAHLNIMDTARVATWDYPVCGNVLSEDRTGRAAAFMCDRCIEQNHAPRYAVEFTKDRDVLYHELAGLAVAQEMFKKATVDRFGNLVCPHCGSTVTVALGAVVYAGLWHCPICVKTYEVTEEIAAQSVTIAGTK